jgi:hypothetical protein
LTDCLGQCEYFADRLARQDRGEGVVLVAWLDGRAVGDVYLWCAPVYEPEICEHLTTREWTRPGFRASGGVPCR